MLAESQYTSAEGSPSAKAVQDPRQGSSGEVPSAGAPQEPRV